MCVCVPVYLKVLQWTKEDTQPIPGGDGGGDQQRVLTIFVVLFQVFKTLIEERSLDDLICTAEMETDREQTYGHQGGRSGWRDELGDCY